MDDRQFNVMITGNSAGLGRGLTEAFLERQWQVFGCSRRGCDVPGVQHDVRCDLADFDAIPAALDSLLATVEGLDLVVLNAGILGEIKPLRDTSVEEVQYVMDVNVWANKVILDWLIDWRRPVRQVLMISSGAAILGNKGWGPYALSKATLNMLARLYSHELPDTHVCALAPGLIDSAMMDYLCLEPDPGEYPAIERLRDARGTDAMPKPKAAALRVISVLQRLREYPSGSFVDIRQMLAPDEYARLLEAAKLT